MELIYITKEDELVYALKKNLLSPTNSIALADNLIICEELDKLNIEYLNAWDYLTPIQILANRTQANKLAKNFIEKKQQQSFLQGEAIYPFEISLNMICIARNIFLEFDIKKITIFKNKNISMLRTGPPPGINSSASISKAILFFFADKKKIQKNEIEINNIFSFKINLNLKNYVRFFSYRSQLINSGKKSNLILLYQTGMHKEEVEFLSSYITEKLDLKIIILSEHTLNILKELNLVKHKKRIDKLVLKIKLREKLPEIFDNKYLNFQFEAFANELSSSVENSKIFEQLILILKPTLLILGHDSFAKERAIVDVAKKFKLKTVSFFHGGISFKFSQRNNYGNSDKFALWNFIDFEWFRSFGIQENKLIKIGSIRYEKSFRDRSVYSNEISTATKKHKIVILTANVSIGFANIFANPKAHLKSLKEFISIAKHKTNIEFVIKCHPAYDYYSLYESILTPSLDNISISYENNLDKLLNSADGILLINYASTAVINSLLNLKDVIYYDRDILDFPDWENSIDYIKIMRCKRMKNVFEFIDKIIEKNTSKTNYDICNLLSFSNSQETLIDKNQLDNLLLEKNIKDHLISCAKKSSVLRTQSDILISFCNGLMMKPNVVNPFKITAIFSYKLGSLFSRRNKIKLINFLILVFLTFHLCKNNKSRTFIFFNAFILLF